MPPQTQTEEAAIVASGIAAFNSEMEQGGGGKEAEGGRDSAFTMKSILWHGGSAWDAWFSCASNQVLHAGRSHINQESSWCVFSSKEVANLQVAQVLLTLPYSFSQLGMLSGVILQMFYGIMGSWTAYLISVLYVEYRTRKEKENVSFSNHVIQVRSCFLLSFTSSLFPLLLLFPCSFMFLSSSSSTHCTYLQWYEVLDGLLGRYWKAAGLAFNCTFLLFGSVIQLIASASNIYYINDRLDKRTWTYIFGACCATTVFIPSFHNYRLWSFLGLGMTTYTAWYLTIAAVVHGQESGLLVDDLLLVPTSAPNSIAAVWKRGRNHDNDALLWVDDAGGRRGALGPDEAGAVLHRSHQHTLHVRRPRGHRVSARIHEYRVYVSGRRVSHLCRTRQGTGIPMGWAKGARQHGDRVEKFLLLRSLVRVHREIMHAMWRPQKFKYIYLLATLYVFTLTLPSAAAVYWAFGDQLLTHSNAFSLLPRSGWRDAAVILMLIHQFITFGFACTPLYFVWEKVIGMHGTRSICLRALARLPVVIPIWFLAIIFPFFGPINSAVGALLVSFTVYIIPALAHILTYRTPSARQVPAICFHIWPWCLVSEYRYSVQHRPASWLSLQNAAEKPPFFLPSWAAMYAVNAFVVGWVLVVGFGIGGWASMTNFIKQVDTFGLFAKCYQCLKPQPPPAPAPQQHH
ncbi:hypothetical protein BHE74_00016928 [Ensete ventricosum]|nr:hypothetical protein BHE74_00016928 [Ensete ventricosum]